MRTPNSPMFKRYEIILVLTCAVLFIIAAGLRVIF